MHVHSTGELQTSNGRKLHPRAPSNGKLRIPTLHHCAAQLPVWTCLAPPSRTLTLAPPDRRTPVLELYSTPWLSRTQSCRPSCGSWTMNWRRATSPPRGALANFLEKETPAVAVASSGASPQSANVRTDTRSERRCCCRSIWAPNMLHSCRATCGRAAWPRARAPARDQPLSPPCLALTSSNRHSSSLQP